jgi:hypothetical protein
MKRPLAFLGALLSMAILWSASPADAAEDLRISKEELRRKIDSPEMIIVDVRTDPDWKASEMKIKRAVYVPLSQVGKLALTYSRDMTIVFYCA